MISGPTGFPGKYEVGYYAPDGEWIRHTRCGSLARAEELVNELNGGGGGSAREIAEQLAQISGSRRREDHELEQARSKAAAQEAANLQETARLQGEAAAAARHAQLEWARVQEESRTRWLVTQEEDRRRARAEAAEQLRQFPPVETRVEGGVGEWSGEVVHEFKSGETVTVQTTDGR